MSKKEKIMSMLNAGGFSDEQIAQAADSTVNSVRWYRSKINTGAFDGKAPKPRLTRLGKVGEVAERLGVDGRIRRVIAQVIECERPMDDENSVYEKLWFWEVFTNSRANQRYGLCDMDAEEIQLHEALLKHPKDLEYTFLHEVAHALAWIFFREGGHGRPWRDIMEFFGLPPERCPADSHTLECAAELSALRRAKRRAKYVWTCEKCGHELQKFRKSKYPVSSYWHRRCGGRFTERAA